MPIDFKPLALASLAILFIIIALASERSGRGSAPRPWIPWDPARMYCLRADSALTIDGTLDEPSWQHSAPPAGLVDMEGTTRAPHLETSLRMLSDDHHLYVGAELQDPHVWAVRTLSDTDLGHDSYFAVFIDPDGDTHQYYEIAVNALGTVSDVLFKAPFRDRENPDDWSRNIQGLQVAVHVDGTVNDPEDVDSGWTVELAIPWQSLAPHTNASCPPKSRDRWRVNFARVVWQVDPVRDGYEKVKDPHTERYLAPDMWSWSPQGLSDMHAPEMWGFVQFSHSSTAGGALGVTKDDLARWALRQLYYEQRDRRHRGKRYAHRASQLPAAGLDIPELERNEIHWPPKIEMTKSGYTATLRRKTLPPLTITEDGRITEQ